jgi:tetratricopeptide (TPR) repeat protein
MKIVKIFLISLLAYGLTTATIAQVDYKAASERLVSQGDIAFENEDGFGALKLYEKSLVANPKSMGAYMGLAKTHFLLGNDGEGFKYFEIALTINPTYLPALEGQALEYLKHHSMDEARVAFAIIQKVCEISACEEVIRVTEAMAAYVLEEDEEKS